MENYWPSHSHWIVQFFTLKSLGAPASSLVRNSIEKFLTQLLKKYQLVSDKDCQWVSLGLKPASRYRQCCLLFSSFLPFYLPSFPSGIKYELDFILTKHILPYFITVFSILFPTGWSTSNSFTQFNYSPGPGRHLSLDPGIWDMEQFAKGKVNYDSYYFRALTVDTNCSVCTPRISYGPQLHEAKKDSPQSWFLWAGLHQLLLSKWATTATQDSTCLSKSNHIWSSSENFRKAITEAWAEQ